MPATIKAIVFRTAQLAATNEFFEKVLKLSIKETSPRHFLIHSKGMRVVFLESPDDFAIDLYVTESPVLETSKDPNGITVINT